MVNTVAFVLLDAFAGSIAIRGAIDLGWAAELEEANDSNTCIYGPVLTRVHYLESEIAQYPRIVVGSDLIKYIDLISQVEYAPISNNPQNALNKKCANRLHKLIYEDIDGEYAIDFLGELVRQALEETNHPQLAKLAFDFIEREYKRFLEQKDSKLAMRYRILLEYCSNRLAE